MAHITASPTWPNRVNPGNPDPTAQSSSSLLGSWPPPPPPPVPLPKAWGVPASSGGCGAGEHFSSAAAPIGHRPRQSSGCRRLVVLHPVPTRLQLLPASSRRPCSAWIPPRLRVQHLRSKSLSPPAPCLRKAMAMSLIGTPHQWRLRLCKWDCKIWCS